MIPNVKCLICTGFTYVTTSKCLIRTTFQSMKYVFPYHKKHLPCKESSCKDFSMLVIFTRVEVEGPQKLRGCSKTTKKLYQNSYNIDLDVISPQNSTRGTVTAQIQKSNQIYEASYFSPSSFLASFASTLNVTMIPYAIPLDGQFSRVFRFPQWRRLGKRQH